MLQRSSRILLVCCLCFALVKCQTTTEKLPVNSNKNGTDKGSNTIKVKNEKKEMVIKAGKRASLECSSIIQSRDAVVSWKANGNDVSGSSGKYSFFGDPANSDLTINDVTYSDRDVYTCMSTYKNKTSTLEVTLRVRDPLGALWPVIGIGVEIMLLFVIIWVYEYTKTKAPASKHESVKAIKSDADDMHLVQ